MFFVDQRVAGAADNAFTSAGNQPRSINGRVTRNPAGGHVDSLFDKPGGGSAVIGYEGQTFR